MSAYHVFVSEAWQIPAIADYIGWSKERLREAWDKCQAQGILCTVIVQGDPPPSKKCPICNTRARLEVADCKTPGCPYIWPDDGATRPYDFEKLKARIRFCPECGEELVPSPLPTKKSCLGHGDFIITQESSLVSTVLVVRWKPLKYPTLTSDRTKEKL